MKRTLTIILTLITLAGFSQILRPDVPVGFSGAIGGSFGFSSGNTATLETPSILITDSAGTTITMSITSVAVDSIVIERGAFNGTFSRLAAVTSPYTNSSLTYGTGYKYRAKTYKGALISEYSNSDSATTWTWPFTMMTSYALINSPYGTYTQAQKDTIVNIFSIQSIQDTFYTKYAKTTCDFAMVFFNSNKTTALVTKIWAKTGRTGVWRFGRKSYDQWVQTNLPPDTCKNGWLIYTSVDGLSSITRIDLNTNTFISNFPFGSLPSGLIILYLYLNQFTGNLTDLVLPSGLTQLYLNANPFTGNLTDWVLPSGLTQLFLHTNQFTGNLTDWVFPSGLTQLYLSTNQFTGNLTDWVLPSGLTQLFLHTNQFTGNSPNITPHATNELIYRAYSPNTFTSASNITTFRKAMTEFRLDGNALPTAKVDELLHNMYLYYTTNAPTANCTINLSGATMGIPTGGASNANLVALQGIWTAAGKVLTITVRTS